MGIFQYGYIWVCVNMITNVTCNFWHEITFDIPFFHLSPFQTWRPPNEYRTCCLLRASENECFEVTVLWWQISWHQESWLLWTWAVYSKYIWSLGNSSHGRGLIYYWNYCIHYMETCTWNRMLLELLHTWRRVPRIGCILQMACGYHMLD